MDLLSKIKLSGRFGKMVYLISAILSVAMATLVVYTPRAIPFCIIIKLFSVPTVYYLNSSMTKGLDIYFYLNLGMSRREYYLIPFAVEFVAFSLLMIISGVIGYAIG